MRPRVDLSLYLVLDAQTCQSRERLLYVGEKALAAGISMLQLRSHHPDWTKKIWYETALALKAMTQHYCIPFLINDEIDIALAVDADGVHIGQDDLPPSVVRRLIGTEKILGLSTHNQAQVLAVDSAAVDYIGIGPVYATDSKAKPDPVLGLNGLREAAALKKLPAVAIGGIHHGNAAAVRACGADGIAVISAVCRAADIEQAVRSLKNES